MCASVRGTNFPLIKRLFEWILESSVMGPYRPITPYVKPFPLLNCAVSRDAALTGTSVSIDNEEFHFICIPI
jgi:hypothetical protein